MKGEEYTISEIKRILEDSHKYGIKIKISSDTQETKFINISKERLIALYNSFY